MIEVSDKKYPIVTIRFVGRTTDDEFDQYLGRVEEILYPQSLPDDPNYCVIVDARTAGLPSAGQATKQADWLRQHSKALRERCKATAYVIPNPALRGALRAILWLTPHPGPYSVFERPERATMWATRQLHGV